MEDLSGHQFDYYLVEEEIGRGGMARVYRARDTRLGRLCALKVLLPEFAADEQYVHRFVREARSAAQLDHPHIVPIYDVGHTGRQYYISMRYYTGGTLLELLRGGTLTTDQIVTYLGQAASALDFAHTRGIIHRDVKPSNMIIDQQAGLILTDFGIAAQLNDPSVTSTGLLVGTPAYFTPEQIRGQQVSPQTDIYQLGASTYELLSGTQPFADWPSHAVLAAHLEAIPAPVHERGAGVNPRVSQVIAKAMDKEPANRYPTATAYVDDLRRALRGETPLAAQETTVVEPAPPPGSTPPPAGPPPPPSSTTEQQPAAGGAADGGSSKLWWLAGGLLGLCGLLFVVTTGVLAISASNGNGGLFGLGDDPTATSAPTATADTRATETAQAAGQPTDEGTATSGDQSTATATPESPPTSTATLPPTSTPITIPTPTLPAIPELPFIGDIVAEDDLLVDWPIEDADWGASYVENDAYHVRVNPGQLRIFFTNAVYDTYLSYSIDLRMISSSPSEACLEVFYNTDGDLFHEYYILCIDNLGNISAGYLTTPDQWDTFDIVEVELQPLTVTPTEWNSLMMISIENQLWFLVNGVPAGYTDTAVLQSGQTGMSIYNTGDEDIEWEFTNLVVRNVE